MSIGEGGRMGDFLGVKDYQDLIEKCSHDLDDLPSHEANEKRYGYRLIDIINTLNHLFDWVLNDPNLSDAVKVKFVQHFNPYSNGVSGKFKNIYDQIAPYPPTNENQALVRKLSNGAKHMMRIQTDTIEYSIRDVPRGGVRDEGWRYAAPNDPRGQGWKHRCLYSVDDDSGRPHDVEALCDALWQEWTMRPFLR